MINSKLKALQGAIQGVKVIAGVKKGVNLGSIKQSSQRDTYAKAMNKAIRKGGSNGVGVGY